METLTKKSNKDLVDLIIINNDRVEGYKLASEKVKNNDALKNIFLKYSEQSKRFSKELEYLLPEKKYIPAPDTTHASGKLHRVWMDLKSTVSQSDHAILSSCEFGEDMAKKNYEEILEKREDISEDALDIIKRQKEEVQKAHDEIKSLRDKA